MPAQRTTAGKRRRERDFDYVTVGHVTADVIDCEDGARASRPGGGAFYSALQAARLGLRVLIVTKGRARELDELLEPYRGELDVRIFPAEHTTTLATSGAGATRRQRVLAWAGAITEPLGVDTAILHLAAVARETPTRWLGQAEFVGVTPQGLVRAWDDSGAISLVPLDPRALPDRYDALVISQTELGCSQRLIAGRPDQAVVAVTAGSQPITVHLPDGSVVHAPTPTIKELRDDLGAGDVFAAAFFVALRDGLSPADAAAYGNAAAAVRIAGFGPGAVGEERAVRAQLGAGGAPPGGATPAAR